MNIMLIILLLYIIIAISTFLYLLIFENNGKFGHKLDWILALVWPFTIYIFFWSEIKYPRRK